MLGTDLIAQRGATWTVRAANRAAGAESWKAGADVPTYRTCKAHSRHFKPVEIRGGVKDHDLLVMVDASTLDGDPPAIGDRVAEGEHADDNARFLQVVAVYPTSMGQRYVTYRLQCRA